MTDIINTWTKKEFLQVMSDTYKDAHGIRPRGIKYSEWSLVELREEFLSLCKIIDNC